jgi:hypothetical protein
MLKLSTKILVLLGFGLLALVSIGCSDNTSTTTYRIASATNRPTREVAGVSTRDAERELLVVAPPRRTPTVTATGSPAPSETATVEPSATETIETPEATEAIEVLDPTATEDADVESDSDAPELATPTATTIYEDLRTLQTDRDLVVRFTFDSECYLADQEVTGSIALRSLKDDPVYIYLKGQISFSINNSPLLPDFPPNEPVFREDFVLLQPNEEVTILEFEDINPYIQSMGPDSGIDFFATDTLFGLPVGNYWVTAGYSNPHDGLTRQIDDSFLIPEAAWRGTTISRELRFVVVENEEDCSVNE